MALWANIGYPSTDWKSPEGISKLIFYLSIHSLTMEHINCAVIINLEMQLKVIKLILLHKWDVIRLSLLKVCVYQARLQIWSIVQNWTKGKAIVIILDWQATFIYQNWKIVIINTDVLNQPFFTLINNFSPEHCSIVAGICFPGIHTHTHIYIYIYIHTTDHIVLYWKVVMMFTIGAP